MPHSTGVGADLCQVSCLHPDDVARARAGLEDDRTYIGLAELFAALADQRVSLSCISSFSRSSARATSPRPWGSPPPARRSTCGFYGTCAS